MFYFLDFSFIRLLLKVVLKSVSRRKREPEKWLHSKCDLERCRKNDSIVLFYLSLQIETDHLELRHRQIQLTESVPYRNKRATFSLMSTGYKRED